MSMETTFPTTEKVGRILSTPLIDPLVDAFTTFLDSPSGLSLPKVNVAQTDSRIRTGLAAPGLAKEDVTIRADCNL